MAGVNRSTKQQNMSHIYKNIRPSEDQVLHFTELCCCCLHDHHHVIITITISINIITHRANCMNTTQQLSLLNSPI